MHRAACAAEMIWKPTPLRFGPSQNLQPTLRQIVPRVLAEIARDSLREVRLRGRRNGGTVACGAGPASHKRGKGWHCINTVCPSAVTLPRANLHFRREAMAIEIPLLSTIKKREPILRWAQEYRGGRQPLRARPSPGGRLCHRRPPRAAERCLEKVRAPRLARARIPRLSPRLAAPRSTPDVRLNRGAAATPGQ